MNLKLNLKSLLLGGLIVAGAASAADTLPAFLSFVFQPGKPIRASEVNRNFANLSAELSRIEAAPLRDGSVTAPKLATQNAPAGGKFLAYNGTGLTWADGKVGPQGPKGDPGPAGPKGDPGAPGPASAQALGVQTVSANFTVPSLVAQYIPVACPNGKVPISGGYRIVTPNIPANYGISKDFLDAARNGWSVQIDNFSGGPINLDVYATCVLG